MPPVCTCGRLTLEAEKRGELAVFTCPICISRSIEFHGRGQLLLFPRGERESSVSALVDPGGREKERGPGQGLLPF